MSENKEKTGEYFHFLLCPWTVHQLQLCYCENIVFLQSHTGCCSFSLFHWCVCPKPCSWMSFFSRCSHSLDSSYVALLTIHVYVLMISKFISPYLFLGSHTYRHNDLLNISPWRSDIHLKFNTSKTKFLFLLSTPASLAAIHISVSDNSILPVDLNKTLGALSNSFLLFCLI